MATLTSSILLAGFTQLAKLLAGSPPQDANFPAANLLLPRLSERWRSPQGALTGVALQFDLGGSQSTIDHVILHGVNLSKAATRRVRVATALTAFTGGAGTVTADSTAGAAFDGTYAELLDPTPPVGRTLVYLPASSVTGAYVEVSLTDTSISSGQIEACFAQVGPNWQPAKSFSPDWRVEDVVTGQPGMEKVLRKHVLQLYRLTIPESVAALSLLRNLKRAGRLFVVPQPQVPASWLSEVVMASIDSYAWSTIPMLPNFRSITVTFIEIDD